MDDSDITAKLASYIFSGKVAPGDRLIERNLSKILGISRIPVREVLSKLTARGILVRDKVNRSLRMREYDSKEVSDLLAYREAIEIASIRAACEKSIPEKLICFDALCDQMMEETGGAVSSRWVDLDRKFHQSIVEAAGNSRFIDDFYYLSAESHYVFYIHPARTSLRMKDTKEVEKHMRHVVEDHRKVVKAMRDHNVQAAVDSLRRHLRTASDRLSHEIVSAESKAMINHRDSELSP